MGRRGTTVDERGTVYFAQATDGGPVKIGFTTNMTARLAVLQTDSWQRLQIVHSMPGNRCTEYVLHEAFEPLRVKGEWFLPSAEMVRGAGVKSVGDLPEALQEKATAQFERTLRGVVEAMVDG
mgnify:FL=1